MWFAPIRKRSPQGREPGLRDRVVVASDDPEFWVGLQREAPELEEVWILADTARECLVAAEDPRVRVVILDGAMHDATVTQTLQLLKRIRPEVGVVFAFDLPDDSSELEARQAGVLFYGDRNRLIDLLHVVRQNLRRPPRPRPRPVGRPDSKEARRP